MMSVPVEFPQLSCEELEDILKLPTSQDNPLRVVLDTDFNNEVDDYFALVWLLLQSLEPLEQLNRINLEAIYIAPYSFKTRLESLLAAYDVYLIPPGDRTEEEEELLAGYESRIQAILNLGITPDELALDPHLNGSGDLGVEKSYQSVLSLFQLMGISSQNKVFKGATHFMNAPYQPVESEAVQHLIELALTASPSHPLYVISIGCPTNVASALLQNPEILDKIVVIWDAGYPTNVHNLVNDSLNLDEDLFASQLLFNSGVPLVYIPGFYIAQQLNMSLPDVTEWFQQSGQVGNLLYDRYINNPLFSFYGIDPTNLFGRNWVIWDIANVAWLLNPSSVSSKLVKSPILTDEKKWDINPNGHWIREAYQISVNSIFPDFARHLRTWSTNRRSDRCL